VTGELRRDEEPLVTPRRPPRVHVKEGEGICRSLGSRIRQRVASSAITTKTSTIRPDYYRSTPARIAAATDGFALRTHFALRYGGASSA
jgi:hypothetical protein